MPIQVTGQDIPTGSWRTHLVYYNTETVEPAGEKIYCASQNGFFFYDTKRDQLETLSKLDGLSDTEISDLEYVPSLDFLVIAYANGNVDLFNDKQIINVRTILNAPFQNKELFSVNVYDKIAYFSLSFGVVKYDLENLEVIETYANLGQNGGEIDVFDLTITSDSIFIVSGEGMKVAANDPLVNKQDFANWNLVLSADNTNLFHHIESIDDEIYLSNQVDYLNYHDGIVDSVYSAQPDEILNNIVNVDQAIYLASNMGISIFSQENSLQMLIQDELLNNPFDLAISNAGELWVADNEAGLLTLVENSFIPYFPSGPLTTDAFKVRYFDNKLVVLRGGVENGNPLGKDAAFYVFQDGEWTNFTSQPNVLGGIIIPPVKDLCDIAYHDAKNKAYLTSFGNGLLEWDLETNEVVQITDAPFGTTDAFLFGVVVDGAGTVWTATAGRVYAMHEDGSWASFITPSLSQPFEILLSFRNELWIRENQGGIFVFKDGQTTQLSDQSGRGGLPSNEVLSMDLDRDGDVWIGTSDGIGEIFAVFDVINEEVDAFKPIYDGTELLSDFAVSAIAIDGGNREWLGTDKGLWLFSRGGSQLEHFFTVDDSPLPSDQIISLDVNDVTGELMVITDKGMVSYRSRSSVGGREHGQVKIFPNPITPNFNGFLTINGLVEDAVVKITDVRGQLIAEGEAIGGTFTWDLKDYNGRRPNSGVFLVFSADEEGLDSYIGKFSFIR